MGAVRDQPLSGRGRDFAIAFAAGAAMLLASLANFLTHNSYPYLRVEIGLIVAGMLALAALMAAWYLPQRQWGRSFLEGLLAAVFIDLNTDSIWLMPSVLLAVGAFTAWRGVSLLAPMAILGSVICLTTLAGLGGRPPWIVTMMGDAPAGQKRNLPAVIHLILDEHIGLEGLAYEGPKGIAVRDELLSKLLGAGFSVFGGAYSEHYHSANSVPFMLNYGQGLGLNTQRRGVETGPTLHLKRLVAQGYRLTVLQSDYADFCTGARYFQCMTYDSSSLHPTLLAPMHAVRRAELIFHKVLKLSDLFGGGMKIWDIGRSYVLRAGVDLPRYSPTPGHSSSVGSMEAFHYLLKRLETARPGDAFFAHLLFPHHPYVVGGDCQYVLRPWEGLTTQGSLAKKRAAYYEQLGCVQQKVQAALSALSKSSANTNHVIIIHGDHGSRLTRRMGASNQEAGQFDDGDMIASFSTLFAVRTAVPTPQYSDARAPVSLLLREFADSQFMHPPIPPTPSRHLVFLADSNWKPLRRVPMPASWTKGLDRPAQGQ